MGILWAILIVLAILVTVVISMYNKLVSLRNEVKNAWAGIDVQLKRRYDLIPNLVETAKGYMTHERTTLENVVKARQQAIDVSGVKEQGKAENFLSQTLKSLFAVVENYPNLKANQNMLALQEQLTSTENKISFSRNNYNDRAMKMNKTVEQFPTNLVASTFDFKKEDFFEVLDSFNEE